MATRVKLSAVMQVSVSKTITIDDSEMARYAELVDSGAPDEAIERFMGEIAAREDLANLDNIQLVSDLSEIVFKD